MGVVIGLIIAGVIFFKLLNIIIEDNSKVKKQEYKNMGHEYIESDIYLKYVGGLDGFSVNTPISIDFLRDAICIRNAYNKKIIDFKNVDKVYLQNERQIQENTSLGKLLVFGVFAFGMDKKKKEINNEYIIFNITENDDTYDIIFEACNKENNQEYYNRLNDIVKENCYV